MCACKTTIIKEKEAINLEWVDHGRGFRKGIWKRIEGGNWSGGRNDKKIIQLKYIKNTKYFPVIKVILIKNQNLK